MFHGRYLVFMVLFKLSTFIGCCVNEPVDVQTLNTKLLELENEILRLKATVCGRDQEMREMAKLRESSQQTEAAIENIRTEMSELSLQTIKPVVAFRSFLTSTISSIPLGQTIVFDRVDLNVGNAYNGFNGVFTAPYNDIAELRTKLQQTEAKVNVLQTEQIELTKDKNHFVAFRSTLSSNQASTVKILVFDQAGMNIGEAYNKHNGIFTAPYKGVYLFSMALGNPVDKPGTLFMIQSVRNQREVIGYTIAGHTRSWNTGALTVVTELQEESSVWVEFETNAHGTYPVDRHHTAFSGVLLHKT